VNGYRPQCGVVGLGRNQLPGLILDSNFFLLSVPVLCTAPLSLRLSARMRGAIPEHLRISALHVPRLGNADACFIGVVVFQTTHIGPHSKLTQMGPVLLGSLYFPIFRCFYATCLRVRANVPLIVTKLSQRALRIPNALPSQVAFAVLSSSHVASHIPTRFKTFNTLTRST
jgi:hypothetical protein